VACSLDGFTALPDGRSQWITGPEARADGHAWRRRAGAIVTGVGTVLADDPRMDVRLVPTVLQPARYVVDSTLRSPFSARIFAPPGHAVVVTARAEASRVDQARQQGLEVLCLPPANDQVDLHALMQALAERQVNEVHVEAGARLNGRILELGLVDEILVYRAPLLIGRGLGMFEMPPPPTLAAALRFMPAETRCCGADFLTRLRLRENPDDSDDPACRTA
jgi:diaminohydroxyphosphoribosylaminopyrimidine deaminase/5-amino-6-(5-phosphoribosylamino)uracil reductase